MLLLIDLLSEFRTLCELCAREVEERNWLDAYLLAAGANQVAEDYLHPDPLMLGHAGQRADELLPFGRGAGVVLRGALRAALALGEPRARRWAAWQREWASQVVLPLATSVADAMPASIERTVARLTHEAAGAPRALAQSLLRLPSCFTSFDQQPEDVQTLVARFSATFPEHERPLAVVGIRSSGSYLAPLCTAYLRSAGYRAIVTLTIRPGRSLRMDESRALGGVQAQGGLALLLDDPPATGRAYAQAAHALQRLGFAPSSVVPLVPLFDATGNLPAPLRRYPAVVLSWPEWRIHARLTPEPVRGALRDMLSDDVVDVERQPLPERSWARAHVRARYRVQPRSGHRETTQDLCVEGVGLGYFGHHALAVARQLSEFVPHVYGARDGLLFREWLPDDAALLFNAEANATGVADYIARRNQMLPLSEDKSLHLRGRDPVWEIAGYILEKGFGARASRVVRPIVHAAARALLATDRPSVIDGATGGQRWFRTDASARIAKIGFAERDFSNLDGFCCDPMYDLAGVDPGGAESTFSVALRREYELRTGEIVDAERWLLYRLVHLETSLRVHPERAFEMREASARALQEYYAQTLFSSSSALAPTDGRLCAIDLDGVLEIEALGFLGLTPMAALALRALSRHGYAPVLATGRSLEEVRDRCAAYTLTGGVAEYGSVMYNHPHGRVIELLSDAARADLDRVRRAARELEGTYLDERHQRSVRAFRLDARFDTRPLAPDVVEAVLDRARGRGRVRVIQGESQTDFASVETDKGVGLRALARTMFSSDVITIAIGDSSPDLPMLALAQHAFAPANAHASVRAAGVSITPGAFQIGFVQAVSRVLGHAPGTCGLCRSARVPYRARLLLTILGAQDHSGARKLAAAAKLLRTNWRSDRLAPAAR